MGKIFTLLLFSLLLSITLSAQYYINQNKHWVFGANAGVDFTSGVPISFIDSFNADEGGATVSSVSGDLLFYTDGNRVWNKNGHLMPSGSSLVGYNTTSTTQSTVVVPMLNSPNHYYIFSLESYNADSGAGHLSYSVLDMSQDGGLGAIQPDSAGILMDSMLGEKMIVVPGNNCNFWVIVHRKTSATFLAYEITNSGISFSPVVSSVGSVPRGFVIGVIKISPNRRKLVKVDGNSTMGTELYDFDPNTGIISNCSVINSYSGYGAEFSPDNSKLYTSTNDGIDQYDISLPTLPAIVASRYNIIPTPRRVIGDMKLGPDGKIYFRSVILKFVLSCIDQPNFPGSLCNYSSLSVSLAPDTSSIGLPNVFWLSGEIPAVTICQGATASITTSATGLWSSNNTAIATVNAGTGMVTGVAPGTATIYNATGCGLDSSVVTVNATPRAITGDTLFCSGTATTLSDLSPGGTWSSNDTDVATINSSGIVSSITAGLAIITYSLPGGCTATAPVTIGPPAPHAGTITGDTVLCMGAAMVLTDTATGGIWSSGSPGIATISNGVVRGIAAGSATISYAVIISCGTAIAIKDITVYPSSSAGTITGPPVVCTGTMHVLNDTAISGIWSSSNTIVATINSAGQVFALAEGIAVISYTTGIVATGCAHTATYTLTVQPVFTFNSAESQISCYGDNNGSISVTVNGGSTSLKYAWSNGDSTAFISQLGPDPYFLTITDLTTQCIVKDTFSITQPDPLEITPIIKNDLCNESNGSISLDVSGGSGQYTYQWSDNATGKEIYHLAAGIYTVSVTDRNNCRKSISATVNEDTCINIVIHNVLTPNGDGMNDTWIIEGLNLYPDNMVQLFDKWGDMVYEKTNYNNDWGGKGKSGALPDGTYYYLVKLNATNLKGGQNTWTGALLIKR